MMSSSRSSETTPPMSFRRIRRSCPSWSRCPPGPRLAVSCWCSAPHNNHDVSLLYDCHFSARTSHAAISLAQPSLCCALSNPWTRIFTNPAVVKNKMESRSKLRVPLLPAALPLASGYGLPSTVCRTSKASLCLVLEESRSSRYSTSWHRAAHRGFKT